MSRWRRLATEGAEFWISCKALKLLRKAGRLQLIQNSAPSVARRRQFDVRIVPIEKSLSAGSSLVTDDFCLSYLEGLI